MTTLGSFASFRQRLNEALNDTQKSESATHLAWAKKTPHTEDHVHSSTMGGGHYTASYTHAKHIDAVIAHHKAAGFTHDGGKSTESGLHPETIHTLKHEDGRSVEIRHEHKDPKNVEIVHRSPITKNAPKPGSRPGATKAARDAKQRAADARYD